MSKLPGADQRSAQRMAEFTTERFLSTDALDLILAAYGVVDKPEIDEIKANISFQGLIVDISSLLHQVIRVSGRQTTSAHLFF